MNPTIAKLRDVMNAHDADAMAALFTPDYRSEQPAHPNRTFDGHAQVAKNWSQLFAAIPDLTVEVVAESTDGATAWAEWRWTGHNTDGSVHETRGVTIMGLTDDGLIAEQRLYMEPVERDGAAIDETVQQIVHPAR
jgi:ketosteroid isomerase-like protein